MSRDVLIYEPSSSGHRGYYAQVLAQELVQSGFDVTLAMSTDEFESPAGVASVKKLEGQISLLPVSCFKEQSHLKRAKMRFKQVREVTERLQPKHLYIPSAGGISKVWGTRLQPAKSFHRNTVLEGLIMHDPTAYSSMSRKQALLAKLSRKALARSCWHRLHSLDPISIRSLAKSTPQSFGKCLRVLPEAIELPSISHRSEALECLGLPYLDGRFITCPGSVSERKGSHLLIKAFAAAKLDSDTRLILVGNHSDGIRAALNTEFRHLIESQQIVSIDRFASDQEFESSFAVADLVAIPYPRHMGSSSILIRAASAGKNILASDWGWTKWAIENFSLGSTCDVNDIPAFAHAMTRSLEQPLELSSPESEIFLKYHTLENHLAHWLKLIREINDMPQGEMVELTSA